MPSCVMSPRDWTTSQLAHAFVLGAIIDGAVDAERQRWNASTLVDQLPLHYVRPTLFYFTFLFIYLFIISRSSCITRSIAPSSPHQTSPHQTHHLQAPPPCRQAPRSQSARLDCALQYYKPLPIAEPLSVLTVRYSPRFSNNVSLRPKTPSSRASWSASASCATGGGASRGDGRGWQFDLLVTS